MTLIQEDFNIIKALTKTQNTEKASSVEEQELHPEDNLQGTVIRESLSLLVFINVLYELNAFFSYAQNCVCFKYVFVYGC